MSPVSRKRTLSRTVSGRPVGPGRLIRLRLTEDEAVTLDLFLHHALDAAAGDTRPDHGLAKMRGFWKYDQSRWKICAASVRLARLVRFPRQKKKGKNQGQPPISGGLFK